MVFLSDAVRLDELTRCMYLTVYSAVVRLSDRENNIARALYAMNISTSFKSSTPSRPVAELRCPRCGVRLLCFQAGLDLPNNPCGVPSNKMERRNILQQVSDVTQAEMGS